MIAAARIESLGVPIDVDTLKRLQEHWDAIKRGVINEVVLSYGVFDGHSFSAARFDHWLRVKAMPGHVSRAGGYNLMTKRSKK